MLGFVLSKMQMLIFATGIFIVIIMFFNLVSVMQMRSLTASSLDLQIQTIQGQLITDSLCSYESMSIPEFFEPAVGGSRLYYDLIFSKTDFDDVQQLTLLIKEHKKNNLYTAKQINVRGSVVLVDPGFIAADEPMSDAYYDKESVLLYPRASTKLNNYAPPNAFISLKEITGGKQSIYVIPCSTFGTQLKDVNGAIYYLNNCEINILKVGCHKLFLRENMNPKPADKIDQCFEVEREIVERDNHTTQVSELTWDDCKKLGYHTGSA
jgi:hypothetical protein